MTYSSRVADSPELNGHRPSRSDAERDPAALSRAFGRLPNEIARDGSLSPEALVVLALRTTFTGNYALHENTIASKPCARSPRPGICSGLSRDIVRRAVTDLKKRGHLSRTQPCSPGENGKWRFHHVRERLCLPEGPETSRQVRREWCPGKAQRGTRPPHPRRRFYPNVSLRSATALQLSQK